MQTALSARNERLRDSPFIRRTRVVPPETREEMMVSSQRLIDGRLIRGGDVLKTRRRKKIATKSKNHGKSGEGG
jgi:hypothetical protein